MVYKLLDMESPFQRYPGVEGSFYFVGGVDFDFSLFGESEVEAPSLSGLLSGTVAFSTPDEQGEPVVSGHRSVLHQQPDESWQESPREDAGGQPSHQTRKQGEEAGPSPILDLQQSTP